MRFLSQIPMALMGFLWNISLVAHEHCTDMEKLKQELSRNIALLKSLSEHIEHQKKQLESAEKHSISIESHSDDEDMLYKDHPLGTEILGHTSSPEILDWGSSPASLPSKDPKCTPYAHSSSLSLQKALLWVRNKQFKKAYDALIILSADTHSKENALILYQLGMLDLYQNKKPHLAARWFSKTYGLCEKSNESKQKILSVYALLRLTQALIQHHKKDDAKVIFDQCQQQAKKAKDLPKPLTQAIHAMKNLLMAQEKKGGISQIVLPQPSVMKNSSLLKSIKSPSDEEDLSVNNHEEE